MPTGIPEPRHREVKLPVTQVPVEAPNYRPWHWIPASLPRYDASRTKLCITMMNSTRGRTRKKEETPDRFNAALKQALAD